MLTRSLKLAVTTGFVLFAGTAFADHNSRWGEGWANMPNDIHNTRVETRGDNTAFRDFVRQGNGAESENRFETATARDRSAWERNAAQAARQLRSGHAAGGRGGRH